MTDVVRGRWQAMKSRRKKATRGTRDLKSASLGFHDWNLDAREKFNSLLDDLVREGMELAAEEYHCMVHIDGPDLIIELPLGAQEGEGPRWTFPLVNIITDEIELYEQGEGGPIDEDGREHLLRIKATLGEYQDLIEKALAR